MGVIAALLAQWRGRIREEKAIAATRVIKMCAIAALNKLKGAIKFENIY